MMMEGKSYSKTFFSDGGISEFVTIIDKNANRISLIPTVIYCNGLDASSNVTVEVAMQYNAGYQELIFSYVNNINTIEGGTHVAGFHLTVNVGHRNFDKVGCAALHRRVDRVPFGKAFGRRRSR